MADTGSTKFLEQNRTAEQMYPLLKRYCKAITSSAWEAEDLAQETFIRWFKAVSASQNHYQTVSKSLLYKMASHTRIDQCRKQKITEQPLDEITGSEQSQVDRFEIEHAIETLISLLTIKQSIILLLHDVFAFKSQEIAALLNTSVGAIKAALHRGRKALKKRENDDPEEVEHDSIDDEQDEIIQLMVESVRTHTPSLLYDVLPSLITRGAKPRSELHCCLAA